MIVTTLLAQRRQRLLKNKVYLGLNNFGSLTRKSSYKHMEKQRAVRLKQPLFHASIISPKPQCTHTMEVQLPQP